MNRKQKDLLLLGLSLLQLKDSYKVKPDEFIKDYDKDKVISLWESNFSDKKPSIEQLRELAIQSYRDSIKVKNIRSKK